MKRHDEFSLKIPNWDKYNPRKDYKSIPWFRMEASIFDDPSYTRLTSFGQHLFTFLLASCARLNSDSCRINVGLTSSKTHMSPKSIRGALDDLETNQLVNSVSRSWHVRQTCVTLRNDTTRHATNVTKRNVIKNSQTKKDKKTESRRHAKTKELWELYSTAYLKRYGVDPIRNAAQNAKMAQVFKRLGEKDSPQVAWYYVTLNDNWYSKQGHSVAMLLKDCEKLHTMWKTNRKTTEIDKKSAYWANQLQSIEDGTL